jgi:hypothetical protein
VSDDVLLWKTHWTVVALKVRRTSLALGELRPKKIASIDHSNMRIAARAVPAEKTREAKRDVTRE